MWELLARYEWALMLVLVLALGLWELRSIRQTVRRDRAKASVRPGSQDRPGALPLDPGKG